MKCVRCLVSGRVQSVFYRASTRDKARSLDVTGHAINLEDGRVEVLACGDEQSIGVLKSWLWDGPPLAEKTDEVCDNMDVTAPPARFDVG